MVLYVGCRAFRKAGATSEAKPRVSRPRFSREFACFSHFKFFWVRSYEAGDLQRCLANKAPLNLACRSTQPDPARSLFVPGCPARCGAPRHPALICLCHQLSRMVQSLQNIHLGCDGKLTVVLLMGIYDQVGTIEGFSGQICSRSHDEDRLAHESRATEGSWRIGWLPTLTMHLKKHA